MRKKFLIAALLAPFAMMLFTSANIQENTYQESEINYQKPHPGAAVYKKYCTSCHQADGGGVPNLNPPLIKTTYVLESKERLIHIILNGLNENIEIDGETYSNPMPALNILKDQEIADVLTYVRSSFGNNASAITVAEVKAARKNSKK